jgi:hypothetical protein
MRVRGDKPAHSPKAVRTPAEIAARIRRDLRDGGSAEHATSMQWFFKDEIKSHGWYTADLRRAAVRSRREIRKEHGLDFLIEVADELFAGSVLEEKVAAVFFAGETRPRIWRRRIQVVRVVAGPHQQLGRSRRAGAFPDRSHNGG